MAGNLEYRLWQLRIALWIGVWSALCVFISLWTMAGGVALFGVGIGLFVLLRNTGRGPFAQRPVPREEVPDTPEQRERDARYVVTQVLRTLTRAQVAYLGQRFSSEREAVAWLRDALPRGFRDSIEDLHQQLEQARSGKAVPESARLAMRVLEQRERMLTAVEALERARKQHPDHAVANPVVFVITEHLSTDPASQPEVVMLAGWDPDKPTLLPDVDRLNLFSERGAERQIRGQAAFASVRAALGARLVQVAQDPSLFAAPALEEDPFRLGVRLQKVPLGFVIGAAELV